jgi:hypothetical protein
VQAFEPRLTAALAVRWQGLLPEVLAADSERAWLLLGDAEERLGFGVGPEPWLSLLPAYAELQRGEVAHVAELLDAGVPDRRIGRFPALYEAMLAHDLPLSATDQARLRAFAPGFSRLCEELAAAGIPETMQHDDLHGNNVECSTRSPGPSVTSSPTFTASLHDASQSPPDDVPVSCASIRECPRLAITSV